jgi:hypothetical protein
LWKIEESSSKKDRLPFDALNHYFIACPVVLRRFACCASVTVFAFVHALSIATTFEMTSALLVGGARIEVVTDRGSARLPMEDVLCWVKSAADSVRVYYGHYPVSSVSIRISSFRGKGVRNGMAFGSDEGGRITIRVGNETSAAEFASDWTLTHEMVHLAFPSVEENHHWIEEGIATYVEPIARVRAGHLAPERVWADLVRDMPQGLPQKGDRGLDRTHTWGRTYWGGAIFCLLADVKIRQQTKNTKGLEHALRAILEHGGDIRSSLDPSQALRIGDRATGTGVLQDLYEEMKDKPVRIDLDALWADLGVRLDNQEVRFDEGAPSAAIRRAITADSGLATENVSHDRARTIFAARTAGCSRPSR